MLEFQGKAVIVTGGANGIGRALCLAFAQAGAQVLCADVDAQAGARLEAEAASLTAGQPGAVVFAETDVTRSTSCQAAVTAAAARFGGLDILCNNVGIQPSNAYVPAHELPEEMWDRILAVNLKSCFLMTKYSVPEMRKRGGGVIVNTASVQGLQSAKGVSAYAASKGGVLAMTRQLALEYAEDNIRVLAVNPGSIDTPMLRQDIDGYGKSVDELLTMWGKAHPLGRIGRPEEVANLILFLASERAAFMTGEDVTIDGGMMAKGAWA